MRGPTPSLVPIPQRKLQEIVQQIQVVERQGMAHAQEVRRAALVGAELQGVPEDVQLYQSVGKAYISTTKASVMEANDQARVESTKAIEQLKVRGGVPPEKRAAWAFAGAHLIDWLM